jgi:hypothetical protein
MIRPVKLLNEFYKKYPHLSKMVEEFRSDRGNGIVPDWPEWCIYVETPGQYYSNDILHGFWVHLEYDVNNGRTELRLLLDCENMLCGMPLHIGDWTLCEALQRAAQTAGIANMVDISADVEQLTPLISILLYICSDAPEIDNNREPGTSPSRPTPTKTQKGWRLFPPDCPKIWTVGAQTGELLRQSIMSDDTGRSVRMHLRRGHWHGYWTGSKKGKQKFSYKWISPLIVGGYANDNTTGDTNGH